MKNIYLLIICVLASLTLEAQRFKSSKSYVRFYSDAPMEDIEAVNESSTSLIDINSKAIVIVVPIKSFDFAKELMEEHFNENYLESDEYPKATFKGKIIDWDGSEGTKKVTAKGTLEMHGVTNEITIEGDIEYDGKMIKVATVFPIRLEDYKIDIPKAVFYKIAEEVEVTTKIEYRPYEKN